MKRVLGIRAHDVGCLPPCGLAEAVGALGLSGVQLSLPKAIRWDGSGVRLTQQSLSLIHISQGIVR